MINHDRDCDREQALAFVVGAAGYLSSTAFGGEAAVGQAAMAFCRVCPEHLVDDLLEVVLFVSRSR